jgi:quinol monooxygenase YgiN
MIHVVAFLTAKPGQRGAVLDALRDNLASVRAEDGCIEYGAALDADASPAKFGDDVIVVLEKWATPEALAAHAAAPHMKAYAAATRHLIERRAIHVLTPA